MTSNFNTFCLLLITVSVLIAYSNIIEAKFEEFGSKVVHVPQEINLSDMYEEEHDSDLDKETFQCKNGRCISGRGKCNGIDNCGDRSDEDGCTVFIKRPTDRCNGMEDQRFTCFSGQCLFMKQLCNGVNDCDTKEDEDSAICEIVNGNKNNEQKTCPLGYHYCPRKTGCWSNFLICNGIEDCGNGFDDGDFCYSTNLLKVLYKVDEINKVENKISVSWKVYGFNARLLKTALFKYKVQYCEPLFKNCINSTWIDSNEYTLSDLKSNTKYTVLLYLKKNAAIIKTKQLQTVYFPTGVSGSVIPHNVKAYMIPNSKVVVSWEPPINLEGKIMNYTVFQSPSHPPVQVTVPSYINTVVFPPSNATKVSFYVKVRNNKGENYDSKSTKLKVLAPEAPEEKFNATAEFLDDRKITLKWSHIKNATSYDVTIKSLDNNPIPTGDHLSQNELRVICSPNTTYTFKIQPVTEDNENLPPFYVAVKTGGITLPTVEDFNLTLHEKKETTVNVVWSQPMSTGKWRYGIHFSETENNLDEKYSRVTDRLDTKITNLKENKTYYFAVSVIDPHDPYSFGPLTKRPKHIKTKGDGTTTKYILTLLEDTYNKTHITLKWYSTLDADMDDNPFIVNITDQMSNTTTSHIVTKMQNTKIYELTFKFHYGSCYYLSAAKMSYKDLIAITYSAPAIPRPTHVEILFYTRESVSISWQTIKQIQEFYNESLHYLVHVTPGMKQNNETVKTRLFTEPRGIIAGLQAGFIYAISVQILADHFYVSQLSKMQNIKIYDPRDTCAYDYFSCHHRKKCVPGSAICDGVRDCPNGRDESICDKPSMPPPRVLETITIEYGGKPKDDITLLNLIMSNATSFFVYTFLMYGLYYIVRACFYTADNKKSVLILKKNKISVHVKVSDKTGEKSYLLPPSDTEKELSL